MNESHALPAAIDRARVRASAMVGRARLADGRTVGIRPVLPRDFEAERRFIHDLSPESRRRRFHLGIASLPESMLHAFTHIDYRGHVALVAVDGDDAAEPTVVADARYVVLDEATHAEFAIAVADKWQRIGLGRELLFRLGTHARRNGLRRLCGDVLRGNGAMIGLVEHLGGRVRSHPEDMQLMRATFDF